MSSQMEGSQANEQAYGAYRGNNDYAQQQYEIPTYQQQRPPQDGGLDDNLVEAVSQRIVQRINQGATGKVGHARESDANKLSNGQRTAVAIVSVAILAGMAITLSEKGFGGILALAMASVVIILINVAVNNAFHRP